VAPPVMPPGLKHYPGAWARERYGCDCSGCKPGRRTIPLAELKHRPGSIARRRGCECKLCLPSGVVGSGGNGRVYADRPLTRKERDDRSKRKLFGTPVPPTVKHGTYARRVYGCRCLICETIGKRKKRPAVHPRDRWRLTARGRWLTSKDDQGNKIEVICWPPRDAGPDWTCPHPSHKEM